jgi:hypothetical protein
MRFFAKLAVAVAVPMLALSPVADAAPIPIVNSGFEDITGQGPTNEFTFGQLAGWGSYDPSLIVAGGNGANGIFTGTLLPNGTDFFATPAPEGVRVGLLFGFGDSAGVGAGEYGYEQTLSSVFQANTQYDLSVEVGNISSGVSQDGTFFDLSGFPGYRIDLLAGGVVIASDDNSLVIPEGEFATANISFMSGASDALLGLSLGIPLG